jgi:hypothetical protein
MAEFLKFRVGCPGNSLKMVNALLTPALGRHLCIVVSRLRNRR